jgi:hypothetical protein
VRIWAGTVVALTGPAPLDELSRQVLQHVGDERERLPVRIWLEYLAQDAPGQIAERLGQQHILRAHHGRRLLRGTVRWEPVDMSVAAWRAARLRTLLEQREPMELPDIVLTELALAIGLDDQVLRELGPAPISHRDTQAARLSDEFRALAAITGEVAAAALLSHRG